MNLLILTGAWRAMGGKRSHPVVFVVTFTDGTTARLAIDSRTLLNGDRDAHAIAAERQREKLLPDRQIKSIRRVQRH
jgi:hypothetical protein